IDPEASSSVGPISSARAIKMSVVDSIEKTRKIKIDDISTDDVDEKSSDEDKKKKELVKTIDKNSKNKTTRDQALDNIDNNEEDAQRIKDILSDLATNPDDRGSNISGARASRMLK